MAKDFLEVFSDEADETDDPFPAFIDGVDGDVSLAPFKVSLKASVMAALAAARVGPGDILIDLGSGDGRYCTAAVQKYGADSAVGFELDDPLVELSRQLASSCGVSDRVSFVACDITQLDPQQLCHQFTGGRNVTVVVVFLLPEFEGRVAPLVAGLMSGGARVVAVHWPLTGLTPRIKGPNFNIYSESDGWMAEGERPSG